MENNAVALRVTPKDVDIGAAVAWDIFDKNGKVLLKRGAVVTSAKVRQIVLDRGLYKPENDSPQSSGPSYRSSLESSAGPFNPFEIIETCTFRLGRVLYNLLQGKDCSQTINVIADDIMGAYDRDSDAVLGAVHLLYGHAYTTIHPIDVAALCYVLCKASKLSTEETRSVIAACLTSNIGMLELQEELHEQTTPLTDEQKKLIQAHPLTSAKILKSTGVTNATWLKTVLQHHERANGEGYPQKLASDQICQGAKILAICDCYSAMITPRSYKESMEASSALKTLFLERGKEYDEMLSVLLIKHMGVYPPGAYVKLSNGETAVVTHRSVNNVAPKVAAILDRKGMPYSRPILRDCRENECTIKSIVSGNVRLSFSLSTLWGYQAI